ncbi:MAG: hypothetical protein K2L57_02755 [Muribaculaceae bacterium]|nr:hypothetical protein [Muribaculaceae bacterium]
MTVFLTILCILLWAGSIFCLYGRQTAAPALSFLALLLLSFVSENGFPLLPLNATILTGWLCMTLVVTFATAMQPEAVRRQTRGMTFIIGGGITGLALGLLGFSVSSGLPMRYAVMVLAVAAGILLGFLLYTNTPGGRPIRPGSGNFFKYLLAKGFPTAITLMMAGVALVLLIAVKNVNGL